MAMFDSIPDWLPEDPAKHAAAKMALMQFGASMLGGRGNFGQVLGQGLNAGLGGYQSSLAQQQKAAMEAAQGDHWKMQNQKLQAELDEPMALAEIARGINTPEAAPQPAGNVAPVGVTPLSALPQMSKAGDTPAPTLQAQPAAPLSPYDEQMRLGRAYQAKGFRNAAAQAFANAEKFKPKVKDVGEMVVNGQRVMVQTFDDGRPPQILDGFAPKAEKLHFADSGSAINGLDSFTGKPMMTALPKTATPDAVMSDATQRRGQNMVDARSKDSNENARGVIIQTDNGPMLADPRAGTARPVIGPDGQTLAPKMKQIPAPIQKALLENDSALRKVQNALVAVEKYPQAFGVKNYLGDGIRQRTDPDGVTPRALVADIGSLKLHDRSGAAVTAAEAPRLKPFVPDARDDAETVTKKLRLFQQEYEAIQEDINGTYTTEQGYRQPPQPKQAVKPVSDLPKKPVAGGPAVGAVENGYRYKGGPAGSASSWEKI